jgi:PAS domain S-box-containing protein
MAAAPPATPIRSVWLNAGKAVCTGTGKIVATCAELAGWLGANPASLTARNLGDVLGEREGRWKEQLAACLAAEAVFNSAALVTGEEGSQLHYQLETTRQDDRVFVRIASTLPSTTELAEGAWDEALRTPRAQREMFGRLLRAESQLDRLTRRWPGVIFSQRADFSFHFTSPQIEELTGISPAQWRQQPQLFWDVIHEADAEEVRTQIKRAALLRQPMALTYRIRHATTGHVTYLLEHRDPTVTANGLVLGYEGFWIDVTRQTIAERRLSSAAWKETLSVLTMGLAHDFRNLMAGIGALSQRR